MARTDAESRLFVYGSLLDPRLRLELLGREVATIPATLRDYERRRSRYFYVAHTLGSSVSGLVLLELTSCDFTIVDRYEELPTLYTRERIQVETAIGITECWAYLPTSAGRAF